MISIEKLRERDGNICHLCQKPVRQSASMNHPLAPSRDHITPTKHGGPNAATNLKLAHKACNSRRGDMPVEKFREVVLASGFAAEKKIPAWQLAMREEAEKRRARREQILRQMQGV